jgi:hypothetical protein
VMQQAVEDRSGDGGVFEDLAPLNCSWHTFVGTG